MVEKTTNPRKLKYLNKKREENLKLRKHLAIILGEEISDQKRKVADEFLKKAEADEFYLPKASEFKSLIKVLKKGVKLPKGGKENSIQ